MGVLAYGSEYCSYGEIGAIGEILVLFFMAAQEKQERSQPAKQYASYGDSFQGTGAQPQAEGGNQLDVAAADSAAGDDSEEQKESAAGSGSENMVCQIGREKQRIKEAERGKRKKHLVKDDLLLKVRERIEEKKKFKQHQNDELALRNIRMLS